MARRHVPGDRNPKAQQCGWLKDKFGVSWQIAPCGMTEMFKNPGSKGAERTKAAMMKMKRLDVAEPRRAFAG